MADIQQRDGEVVIEEKVRFFGWLGLVLVVLGTMTLTLAIVSMAVNHGSGNTGMLVESSLTMLLGYFWMRWPIARTARIRSDKSVVVETKRVLRKIERMEGRAKALQVHIGQRLARVELQLEDAAGVTLMQAQKTWATDTDHPRLRAEATRIAELAQLPLI